MGTNWTPIIQATLFQAGRDQSQEYAPDEQKELEDKAARGLHPYCFFLFSFFFCERFYVWGARNRSRCWLEFLRTGFGIVDFADPRPVWARGPFHGNIFLGCQPLSLERLVGGCSMIREGHLESV